MISQVVDFALTHRLFVLAFALLLFAGGIFAFHELPIEAYPDVANNYVEVITQWPGIAAEQIEQQVTIPLEIALNGVPHVTHLRSFSLFGLSDVKLIFDDEEENFRNRERVLERLSQVSLPPGVTPTMGTDWSPVGQIYFFTLQSTNPFPRGRRSGSASSHARSAMRTERLSIMRTSSQHGCPCARAPNRKRRSKGFTRR